MKLMPSNAVGAEGIGEEIRQNRDLLGRFNLDGPLLLALLTAAVLGLAVLYSAGQENMALVERQSLRLGLSFLVMIGLAQIPPHQIQVWTPWIYLGGIAMLVAVLLVGESSKGAQRWLNVGVRFQPSEIMKLAVPMMMAWYFANRPLPPRVSHLLVGLLIAVVPVLLIAKQPDLGTALLVACAGAFVLFLGGLSWKIILGGIALIGSVAPLVWQFGLHAYQRQRVLTFLDPESDPLGSGYHIIQSKIAIGSGGLYGKGWLNGTQAHLDFLPEGTTDFVFAVFAEEFGLIGVCMLLVLYAIIVARGLYVAACAPDSFTRLLAGSVALIFFVYVLVNAGMVSGLLPVVGLPLPLISYGGTSLVTIMGGFGMLMSIYSSRRWLDH